MEHRISRINEVLRGWFRYYRIGYFKNVCRRVDRNIRFRLRMCIWKQWKKTRTRYRNLLKLGLPQWKAITWANSRKSYARCASTFLQVAIPNSLFERKGLVPLLNLYQLKHI